MLLEAFLRYKHQQRQSQGYLHFYRHTRDLLSLPFQVTAGCSSTWAQTLWTAGINRMSWFARRFASKHGLPVQAGQYSRARCDVQIAALSSVALLTVELWPNTFAFASDLAKLIGVTICECSLVGAWDLVYLWRVVHDDLPDAYQLLPAVLHAHDMGMRWVWDA